MIAAYPAQAPLYYPDGSQIPFSNSFGIPAPPFEAYYNTHLCNIAIAVFFVMTACLVVYGLIEYRKTGSPIILVLSLCGLGCDVMSEVFLDLMGGCMWTVNPAGPVFTEMGRPMSMFTVAAWCGFGASMTIVAYVMIRKIAEDRKPTSWLWATFIICGLVDAVTEELMLLTHGYLYYGHQPLILLWRFPWYYAPLNGAGLFMVSAFAYRYREQLTGWRSLLLLIVAPMCEGGAYGFGAMPAWIVVNGQYGWLVTQLGGLGTVFLCALLMGGVFMILLKRRPFALGSTEEIMDEMPSLSSRRKETVAKFAEVSR